MDQALLRYLETHRAAVNAATLRLARGLAGPDDTDREARRLVRDTRAALHEAIETALDSGPVEGRRQGTSGDVYVVVRVPTDGQGSIGKLQVNAARLSSGELIPCPVDWPQEFPPPSAFVERLHQMIFGEPDGPSLVEADEGGRVPLGADKAGVAYMMEGLPDGEVWLRPVESSESGKL